MSKRKPERTTPKIAGSRVYGQGDLAASVGKSVYKHQKTFHVFNGLEEILTTTDLNAALIEAAK